MDVCASCPKPASPPVRMSNVDRPQAAAHVGTAPLITVVAPPAGIRYPGVGG